MKSVWFCCGGDAKCEGGCECQCHSMKAELDRIRDHRSKQVGIDLGLTEEISRLRSLVKKAGDLLTYGGPDMELQSDDGSDWLSQCDEWFKLADYGQPRPVVEPK